MNSQTPGDPIMSSSTVSRRTILRLLAATPLAALAVVSHRGTLASALQDAGTPPASPEASPVPCAATPMASPGPAVIVHTVYDATATQASKSVYFDPPSVTIKLGQTITWENTSQMVHTATCDPAQNPVEKSHPEYIQLPPGAKPWGSPMLQPGDSFSHTFTVAGEYKYICIPHVLSGMLGTITVEC